MTHLSVFCFLYSVGWKSCLITVPAADDFWRQHKVEMNIAPAATVGTHSLRPVEVKHTAIQSHWTKPMCTRVAQKHEKSTQLAEKHTFRYLELKEINQISCCAVRTVAIVAEATATLATHFRCFSWKKQRLPGDHGYRWSHKVVHWQPR